VLQLDATRTDDLQPGGARTRPRLGQQAGLPDPGRALDEDQPPAVGGVAEQPVQHGELGVPFIQPARLVSGHL
jgi:hypothetical protein